MCVCVGGGGGGGGGGRGDYEVNTHIVCSWSLWYILTLMLYTATYYPRSSAPY